MDFLTMLAFGVFAATLGFAVGYPLGRLRGVQYKFEGTLEQRALEEAKSKIANRVIEVLSEYEDSGAVEIKR